MSCQVVGIKRICARFVCAKCKHQIFGQLCKYELPGGRHKKMNKVELSPLVDHWKKGLCKQKSLHQKLQEVVRSIINISSSNVNVESITKSMDSLQCLLFRFTDELNNQQGERSFTGWLKSLHSVVTEVISKIQEITEIICAIRNSDDNTHSQLMCKIQLVDSLQWDLNEALCTEAKAYEKLCKREKAQKIKVETLLATVLHHEEIWNQQVSLTNDLMKEILRLSDDITKNPKQTSHSKTQIPIDERSKHLQSLVSKIATDIRKSLCDIEYRQNQVSHLELDLSSVRLVLESAQLEIDEISKTSNTQDVRRKVTVLLLKLKKQISNALIKANNLDFKTPKKTDKGVCATERVLETYEKKCPDRPLQSQFLGVQKALQKEEAAIKNVKGNIMDLKSNIKDRDKLAETQDKTICILQNSLKICQDEAEELHKTIHCLEVRKCEIETESKQKIQELKSKVSQLQNCLKKYEEVNDLKEINYMEKLQNAHLELAFLAGNLQEDCRSAQLEIAKLYDELRDNEKNHQKTEEALKSTIASLKENIYKEQKKYSELEKKNDLLENCKTSSNEAQDRAIDSLQNSLETTQNEISKLHKINECLEREKADIEKDHKEQIKKLKDKICELQNNMKSSEETTEYTEDDSLRKLQNANLELAILAGHLQEDYRNAESKLSEVYQQFRSNETKHHKSEAALQLVISNLKETICKERKKCCEIEKDNKKLQEQVKELEDYSKNATKSNKETADKISDLEKQVMCWSKQALDVEGKLKSIQEKLCKSLNREKELELEMSLKESKYKEEICGKLKEINNLTNAIQSLTEKLSESTTELDKNRLRLQSVCGAYEELKVKEREKEAQADKLQVALTQLSNKFVSRHLDTGTSHCLRHYQEECAKYEALYNTTACKLRSKELEISSLKQEVERLRSEMDHVAMTTLQQKEDESCPFLMERVHQLSKELQVAHSCQNSYESLLKDIREKYSKKEDENFQLKAQIKQITLQRDAVLADLEKAQEEISRFKINNSNQLATIKRLEQNNAQISEQLHKVMYDSDTAGLPQFQPNIELQREISTALSSQLRGVKQKLHSTKHDYKLLQTAYEELNRKYTSLQRGERDLEQKKEMLPTSKPVPRCRPCLAKSSKSVTYIKMPESMGAQDPVHLEYLSHSKSWHKMNNNKDLDWKERKWKQKLQNVIRGDFSPSEAMHHSSSSN